MTEPYFFNILKYKIFLLFFAAGLHDWDILLVIPLGSAMLKFPADTAIRGCLSAPVSAEHSLP